MSAGKRPSSLSTLQSSSSQTSPLEWHCPVRYLRWPSVIVCLSGCYRVWMVIEEDAADKHQLVDQWGASRNTQPICECVCVCVYFWGWHSRYMTDNEELFRMALLTTALRSFFSFFFFFPAHRIKFDEFCFLLLDENDTVLLVMWEPTKNRLATRFRPWPSE